MAKEDNLSVVDSLLEPIGRLEYFCYTTIYFIIVVAFNRITGGQISVILVLFSNLIIMPIFISKRARDLGFALKIVLPLWYIGFFAAISGYYILLFPIPFLQLYLLFGKKYRQ